MKKSELEIREELVERAETSFGKARTAELRADIEQLAAEIWKLSSFDLSVDDEP
jgi:hypothetical protein